MTSDAKRRASCSVMRTAQITHSTLSLTTGEDRQLGQEWITRPCGSPLFSDAEKSSGVCRSCASGWNHPENYRADGPRPKEVTS